MNSNPVDSELKVSTIKPTPAEVKRIEGHGNFFERSSWYRASGLLVCRKCKQQYYDHPVVEGYEWLRRLCSGDFVKL